MRGPVFSTIEACDSRLAIFARSFDRHDGSIPILEFPGFELPRRQVLHPPLHHPIRRPMAETRGFLALRLDDQRLRATARLARLLADHNEEFWFVDHGRLPAKR